MISQKLNSFNTWLPIAIAYLILNAVRLRISTTQITALNAIEEAWVPKWTKYSHVATQTHGSTDDINELYVEYHSYMNRVKLQLKYDMNVELSGDDSLVLEIHVDADPRGEIPAYGFAPHGEVVRSSHLINSIHISSTEEGHADDGKKPVDVARIGMKRLIIEQDAPIPATSTFFALSSFRYDRFRYEFFGSRCGQEMLRRFLV